MKAFNIIANLKEKFNEFSAHSANVPYWTKADIAKHEDIMARYVTKCEKEYEVLNKDSRLYRLVTLIKLLQRHPYFQNYYETVGEYHWVPQSYYGFDKVYTALDSTIQLINKYATELLIDENGNVKLTENLQLKRIGCRAETVKRDYAGNLNYAIIFGNEYRNSRLEFGRVL